ncbi:uncharacterized protein LOC127799164 isoform X2 [Diospyros lotus]|uniref:uncharacterized protein LOC127799164 isoform X2 n=1 Tax=Diospyros lotus TaxID=55363 RepID=UPI002253559C|nr:uncharacterized protein LOC127799164 isoform X2 [Diospyros lotus]
MGSACCVARKDGMSTNRTSRETLHRNAIYSPSWSFQWDNRRRVAGESENISYELSHGMSTNSSMEIKGELILDRSNFSGWLSSSENFGTPTSQKSPVHEEPGANITPASNGNTKVQSESVGLVDPSEPERLLSVPSSSCLSPNADRLSGISAVPENSIQSITAHQSPGHQLSRQLSDSQILALKSPNSNLFSEQRPSFVLPACSRDTMVGSQCGSSDGWSRRTFTKLVASSQRERLSFDSEFLSANRGKGSECSSTLSYSPTVNLQTCGVCSKLLAERSSWSIQSIVARNEVSVIAILVCGHVYHAECLEVMTMEADRYDPSCPICMFGEKQLPNMVRKVLREAENKSRRKIFGNRVVDSFLNPVFNVFNRQKTVRLEERCPKTESSSSGRRSFAKPFLRRHFSLGPRWSRSMSANNSATKAF